MESGVDLGIIQEDTEGQGIEQWFSILWGIRIRNEF